MSEMTKKMREAKGSTLVKSQDYYEPIYLKEKSGPTKPVLFVRRFEIWKTKSGNHRLHRETILKRFKTEPELVRWINSSGVKKLPVPEDPNRNWNDFIPREFRIKTKSVPA